MARIANSIRTGNRASWTACLVMAVWMGPPWRLERYPSVSVVSNVLGTTFGRVEMESGVDLFARRYRVTRQTGTTKRHCGQQRSLVNPEARERTPGIGSLTASGHTIDLGLDPRPSLTMSQISTFISWRERDGLGNQARRREATRPPKQIKALGSLLAANHPELKTLGKLYTLLF